MSELGWAKSKVKWGGVDYARAVWLRHDFAVDRGKLKGPDGFEEAVTDHLSQNEPDITF